MKPILLSGIGQRIQIELVGELKPYLGAKIYDGLIEKEWAYLEDRDLYRLELAIKKCRRGLKKK